MPVFRKSFAYAANGGRHSIHTWSTYRVLYLLLYTVSFHNWYQFSLYALYPLLTDLATNFPVTFNLSSRKRPPSVLQSHPPYRLSQITPPPRRKCGLARFSLTSRPRSTCNAFDVVSSLRWRDSCTRSRREKNDGRIARLQQLRRGLHCIVHARAPSAYNIPHLDPSAKVVMYTAILQDAPEFVRDKYIRQTART